jgi:hypothetical protein
MMDLEVSQDAFVCVLTLENGVAVKDSDGNPCIRLEKLDDWQKNGKSLTDAAVIAMAGPGNLFGRLSNEFCATEWHGPFYNMAEMTEQFAGIYQLDTLIQARRKNYEQATENIVSVVDSQSVA